MARSKAFNQHNTFTQLPKELQSKGEELAKRISNSIGATAFKSTLKKVVNDTNSKMPPYITYRIDFSKRGNGSSHTSNFNPFVITINKDSFKDSNHNTRLPRELNSAVLAFVKKLQTELQ